MPITPTKRPMQIDTDTVNVIIFTEQFKITGLVHVPFKGRITDFLNKSISGKDKDTFLPVTNARCTSLIDENICYEAEFIAVHRDHIHLIIPNQ
ncbi:MAG: hypothetical protein WA162_00445 [Thermodesulfobacteriota bacterium]